MGEKCFSSAIGFLARNQNQILCYFRSKEISIEKSCILTEKALHTYRHFLKFKIGLPVKDNKTYGKLMVIYNKWKVSLS